MIIRHDVVLADVLWYRIGGKARFLLDAACREDVLHAAEFVRRQGIKHAHVLGHGANVLFSDGYFDGAIIRLVDGAADGRHDRKPEHADDGVEIEAYAGETLDHLIHRTFEMGLVGLEWAGGLPGTVGAAVRGNVGAFGGEIKDSISEVDVLDITSGTCRVRTLAHDELAFAYRESVLKKQPNLIALSARFRLKQGKPSDIDAARQIYRANIAYRQAHHPLEYPNTGSTFKNISRAGEIAMVLAAFPDLNDRVTGEWHGKVSMGYLNRRLGFAGFRVGNAEVSEKHCNFILNLGGAKASDVSAVITAIQQTFEETFGFNPEPEVEMIRSPMDDLNQSPSPSTAFL